MRYAALLICVWLSLSQVAHAADTTETPVASISIIIDDLGNSLRAGMRAIRLPGAVACAVLPHRPHAVHLAHAAHASGKEVILHLPMESADGVDLGPGSVHTDMTHLTMAMTLRDDLQAVPHAVGVSNHMGSLFTTQPKLMRWLMQAVLDEGHLFFVDSRTTADSIVPRVAEEVGVPYLVRNVFLDRERNSDAINTQFKRLINAAREHGTALAIGHPYAETLEFLERHLPMLAGSDIELVPLSKLLVLRNEEQKRWQTSLSL
ncbi:MAG: divergent polysaccharide deacetylase family protein [Acidiferrobacterales bacterium]